MSDWAIRLPIRSKRDSVSDLGFNAAVLEPHDRAITRELCAVASLAGVSRATELLEVVESMSANERRFTINKLRERVGLKSASAEDVAEAAAIRAQQNRAWAVENPGPTRLALNPSGTGFVDLDEQALEAARQASEAESRRTRHEARDAERALEAREREAFDVAAAERARSELPEGFSS